MCKHLNIEVNTIIDHFDEGPMKRLHIRVWCKDCKKIFRFDLPKRFKTDSESLEALINIEPIDK